MSRAVQRPTLVWLGVARPWPTAATRVRFGAAHLSSRAARVATRHRARLLADRPVLEGRRRLVRRLCHRFRRRRVVRRQWRWGRLEHHKRRMSLAPAARAARGREGHRKPHQGETKGTARHAVGLRRPRFGAKALSVRNRRVPEIALDFAVLTTCAPSDCVGIVLLRSSTYCRHALDAISVLIAALESEDLTSCLWILEVRCLRSQSGRPSSQAAVGWLSPARRSPW